MKSKLKTNILTYVVMVLFILFITDSPIFQINSHPIFNRISQFSVIFVSLFIILVYFVKNKKLYVNDQLKYLVIIILSLMFTWILNFDFKLVVPMKILLILSSYFLLKLINTERFIVILINTMFVISVFSLITYFYRNEIMNIDLIPSMTTFKGLNIKLLGLSNIPVISGSMRNYGPFWEPSAYQVYLNLTLILILFSGYIKGKQKVVYSIIIITGIMTTLSTTGYITLFIILLARVFKKNKNYSDIILRMSISLIVFILVYFIVINNSTLNDILIGKFDDSSGIHRIDTIKYGFIALFQRPIFGHGSNYLVVVDNLAGYELSFTNSILANFIAYGIVFGLYFVWNYKKFIDSMNISNISKMLLYVAIIAVFSGNNMIYSPLISIFIYLRIKTEGTQTKLIDN